ncbi:NADPH-dependent F420 reductase [Saccharibacillus sacchari]|uniref:NAD(P)-binding domain-containing protein n=1 Tax=Saccharibacillus sacchari TaxID=456493 RepID=A0ACC6P7P0_9BACL
MKFGIIGVGNIGSVLAEKLVNNGYDVKIADVRGIERLEGKDVVGERVSVEDVVKDIDVLIASIPLHALPSIKSIVSKVSEEVIVVDTSNYYPERDTQIEEIEKGMVESVWVSKQLGRPIIKTFNNLLALTLKNGGTAKGTDGRIAITVAGDRDDQKKVIMDIVSELGFDSVDSGSLSESWRQQPGTPAYCTELTKDELMEALKKANKEKSPRMREKVMKSFLSATADLSHEDVVRTNREIYNS